MPTDEIASNGTVGDTPVVLDPDLHLIGHAGGFDPPPCLRRLLLADRHTDDLRTVPGRGVDRHRAPTASDVEQPGAGTFVQAELAADQLVLGRLSVLQRHAGVDEPGARVRHRRAEHE